MVNKEQIDYFRRASVVPSSPDSLFEKARTLSPDDFAEVFDNKVRSHEGFSIPAPKEPVADNPPDADSNHRDEGAA
jgi:hypothetical protein